MKLRQLCIAAVLTLTLSFTAFAGNIDTPGVIAPPPPPNQVTVTDDSLTPEATTNETSNSETAAMGSVTELGLYLLDSMVFSIF